jgi:hypothetical protein
LRTGRIVVWGGGIFAPVVTQWFKVLQKVQLGNAVATTAARVALDQFLCAPVVVTGFFTFMTLTEGKDLGTVRHKLRNVRLGLLRARSRRSLRRHFQLRRPLTQRMDHYVCCPPPGPHADTQGQLGCLYPDSSYQLLGRPAGVPAADDQPRQHVRPLCPT